MSEQREKFNLAKAEEKILEFWEKNKIFEKTLEKTKRGKKFVFYEGPPTANGLPHIGHALTRAFKDIIPRYKTMRGFFVSRKAGWDTHGLPVEIEVEKQLGFKGKQDIEKYGIASFNQKAKESVWRYKDQWEKSTKRLGFWLDLKSPYITYETTYIETLWWIIKEIWRKGLLYQDYKVVPWCSRCGTGLSSHELGLGYKKTKEDSIYVKLKLKGKKNEYLLVWTTTPWTLPANVAVALHPKLEYTKYKLKTQNSKLKTEEYEYIWSAHTPPYDKGQKIAVIEKVSAKSLFGLEYEPLFKVPKEFSLGSPPPFKTLPGEFVTLEEGTGMVHLAPAFGDEDMGVVKNVYGERNYPLFHTVNPDGTMKKGIVGEGLFAKDADRLIIEDLRKRRLLYRVEPHEHDYPFCWRCGTPLLYFSKTAWWIKVGSVKEKLISANQKINWVPEHLREGRFGEFLREVRDWAFSRERYWGTPLPVWKCEKCLRTEVAGSREDLGRFAARAQNKYLIMRHGESLSNVRKAAGARDGVYHLTLKGRIQVEKTATGLIGRKIDLIFSSPIGRARETAEIVARITGVKKINLDKRLEEINVGVFTGKDPKEYHAYFSSLLEKFTKRPPNGETLAEVRARLMDFLLEFEKKYSGKTILIVGHEYPLWVLYAGALGLSDEETVGLRTGKRKEDFIHFAEVMPMSYKNLPRDANGEVNLHRPFVDSFELSCPRCKNRMKRVPEVVDVWFDSGSMPFAQAHYPFTKQKLLFPADYICEAIDQTRGWFYTLLAVSVLLDRGHPYKNVISLGHILDKNGQKMSKSKGNVVDPESMIQKYGADTLRWYFFTLNAVGEPKRFDEKDLFNKLRGFLLTFWNCFALFDTYIDKITNYKLQITNPKNVLDKWILVKLNQLISEVTGKLDSYDIIGAGRAIEEFTINDFSQWFLRRSRRRLQHPDSEKDKNEAGAVTGCVLLNLCKIASPFIPFLTEAVYQELRKKLGLKEISVHLSDWPIIKSKIKNQKSKTLFTEMEIARVICSEALKQRAEKGIKVRQPLAKLQITNYKLQKNKDLLGLIKEEVNVKEIVFGDELKLDTVVTPELKEEGLLREFIRNIQEMRRDAGLRPKDVIMIQIQGGGDIEKIISENSAVVKKETNARELRVGGKKIFKIERETDLGGTQFWIGVNI